MNKINVLVTGAGGGGIGEQVIKCLRLSELNIHITATDISNISKGKLDGDEFIIAPLASDQSYINFILALCREKKIVAVIPGSEAELKLLSQNETVFSENHIILLINSASVIKTCLDKNLTAKFLSDNGFFSPDSFTINSQKDLEAIERFPVVLKPSVGGGGSVNTLIVQNKEELNTFGKFLLSQYAEFIAQEYVGDAENEYTVGVLSAAEGVIIDSIVLKRNILSGLGAKIKILNKSGNASLGKYLAISSGISQGEIIRNELIATTAEQIAQKLNSTGPLNIQCRLQDNKVYVFEINPRFSGTSPMRAIVGFNELDLSLKNKVLKQTKFSRINYKLGHLVRGLTEYFI
jgi:carbamoyl-phosphate synthase large subunit